MTDGSFEARRGSRGAWNGLRGIIFQTLETVVLGRFHSGNLRQDAQKFLAASAGGLIFASFEVEQVIFYGRCKQIVN